jgi:hypothetical protein
MTEVWKQKSDKVRFSPDARASQAEKGWKVQG